MIHVIFLLWKKSSNIFIAFKIHIKIKCLTPDNIFYKIVKKEVIT